MRQYPEIGKVAVFRFLRAQKDMRIAHYAKGYKHISNGVLLYSSPQKPVYMFAKNFTKFKKDFSLFVYTYESDRAVVEKHFDKVVKQLKREDIVQVLNHIQPYKYVEPELL